MTRYFRNYLLAFIVVMLTQPLYAQKDVTQFLGIPVDGFKPDMVRKLKDKGFTNSADNKDILVGEFNGTNVNIHVVTNNNKVCRIMVADANPVSEGDIKIRFNKLCQQFHDNKRYLSISDSSVSKYTLSENEDISYGILVKNKRYEAVFYQKSATYDSLALEKDIILKKNSLTDLDTDHLSEILAKIISNTNFKKTVWFMINEHYGKYYISMFYDNEYNRAGGEDL